jgi:hypothetical protein
MLPLHAAKNFFSSVLYRFAAEQEKSPPADGESAPRPMRATADSRPTTSALAPCDERATASPSVCRPAGAAERFVANPIVSSAPADGGKAVVRRRPSRTGAAERVPGLPRDRRAFDAASRLGEVESLLSPPPTSSRRKSS